MRMDETLSSDVVQEFAKTIIGEEYTEKTKNIYGKIVKKEGKYYVRLDGTDTLSPLSTSVELEDGDRVLLQFHNRELTAIGNITAPGSARTLSKFMKLTDAGLMIGELEDGTPTGAYTLMKDNSFCIVNKDGRVLAEFSGSAINFGNKATFGEDGVTLRNGKGKTIAEFKTNGINFGNKSFFNDNGVTIQDASGNVIAVFSINGVSFPGGNTVFTQNQISLGSMDSVIKIGSGSNNEVVLQIDKSGVKTGLNELSLLGNKSITLEGRKTDSTYAYCRVGFAEEGNTEYPFCHIFGYRDGTKTFEFKISHSGISFSGATEAIKIGEELVDTITKRNAFLKTNYYTNKQVDQTVRDLKEYIDNKIQEIK